ncbi:hypothetical protein [Dysgonomonas sp. 511]|uniref:hypothetical protein n=1 Tax=Dysgonomonas sp. 511 TaxID=2302930 RepID=UPI0013D417A6|nr:hypothetical protein [Dysgonomonas sp. 511]NDV79070.1 hypothetical protein [Dysgonomonas sp. 511]
MAKVIAVLTQKGSLSKGIQENTTVNLFSMENEKVKGVENIKLKGTGHENFSLLMALKKVNLIYMESISAELKATLQESGISIKCKDEIGEDKFLSQFVFD